MLSTSIEEMDGYKLRDITLPQERPNRLEFGAVWQARSNLYRWIRLGVGPCSNELRIQQPGDHLLLHNTALFQSL